VRPKSRRKKRTTAQKAEAIKGESVVQKEVIKHTLAARSSGHVRAAS